MMWFLLAAALAFSGTSGDDARLAWWREARVGLFIHWGPSSLSGQEIGWSRGASVSIEEYDRLYERFDPVAFDADAWMRLAKQAGCRYVVPVSKHHDGFCMWPSDTTDYDIASTPFRRDIIGELAAASRKHGLHFGVYYSILDWWHPNWPTDSPGGSRPKTDADLERYVSYMKKHLDELMTRYRIELLWFDGQWEPPWNPDRAADLLAYCMTKSPKLVINNRVGPAKPGTEPGYLGDYLTPEQHIGAFDTVRPWETCMTLGEQWSYRAGDKYKSEDRLIEILSQVVCGDGNFLINVGPTPEGRIPDEQQRLLRAMGAWLRVHGEAVYATRGGPVPPGDFGGTTYTKDAIYVHIRRTGRGVVDLPIAAPGPGAVWLHTGERVYWVEREGGIRLSIPDLSDGPAVCVAKLPMPTAR